MIPESLYNRVYFSALLPEVCPVTYKGLADVLDRYGVPFSLLKGTKDIWCRDYMPLQITDHEFVAFGYRPDYLMDTAAHRKSITDGYEVAHINGFDHVHDRRDIILDGGNTVHSGKKVILTDKVFEENPVLSHDYLCQRLRMSLGAEPLFVPWDANEIYGHTDGVVRFIDEDTVLMTNYAQLDSKMASRFRRCLEPHFKTIHELRFDIKKPYKNNWAYINWLQTDKVLILPKFNAPEDEQAFEQISALMPEYEGKIVTVEATDLIRHEGCLNCASWTVYEPEEGPRWEL